LVRSAASSWHAVEPVAKGIAVSSHQVLSVTFPRPSTAKAAARVDSLGGIEGIVGSTPALRETLHRLERVAPTDASVLITGETGTGKELLARAIHRRSRRATRQLVAAHLAAVPQALVSSALFGHERGAFTGAERCRIGRFEAADGGTLFLDEVGELSADVQVALLRALQEGEFERVGTTVTRRVDVRVVAATNRDLAKAMDDGRFRADLFYRLSVVPIHLPFLRERRDDMPALADHFLRRSAARLGRSFTSIEPASLARLRAFDWPGNIRQLQNVIEHCAILCDGDELRVPAEVLSSRRTAKAGNGGAAFFADTPTLEEVKKRYIRHLIAATQGNVSRAAAMLDVDRRSLYRMMDRYRIASPRGQNECEAPSVVPLRALHEGAAGDAPSPGLEA
jgi:DNA-binding NtrC family response regulator